MLAVLFEVVAFPAVPGLVGVVEDRVVEYDVKVGRCAKNALVSFRFGYIMTSRALTVVDVHLAPERLALPDHPSALPVECGADEERNLDRVWVGDARVDELVLRDAVDRRREDDVRAHVAVYGVGLDHEDVDVPVEGGQWDGFDLIDVEVVIDGLRRVLASSIVCELTGAGLFGQRGSATSST